MISLFGLIVRARLAYVLALVLRSHVDRRSRGFDGVLLVLRLSLR